MRPSICKEGAIGASVFGQGAFRGYEIHLRVERTSAREPYTVRTPMDIVRLMSSLAHESAEYLYSLNLDGHHQVAGVYLVGKGSCNWCPADPKEIFKAALVTNSPSFALVHHHPSGNIQPSAEDRALVSRISDGARLLGLRLLDSLILGNDGAYYSMREHGFVQRAGHGRPPY